MSKWQMTQPSAVYVLSNEHETVLYVGVTSDLLKRVSEHRLGIIPGFTKRYNVHKLVYYEFFGSIELAIAREKQIKGGSRAKKEALINSMNPSWVDLYDRIRL